MKIIDDSIKRERITIIARKNREWFPGATYHLMERGIRRSAIFQDDSDYQVFLMILQTAMQKNDCIIHAYCLMTNHFHLLLQTGTIEIGKLMKYIASSYAIFYNRKYSYKGHVFEGRYKSCLVKEDSYFLQTSRYIHLNPVKAQMVSNPEEYSWSSYRTMIGLNDDGITETSQTRRYFGKAGIIGYRDFVEDVSRKYYVQEKEIRKLLGEDDLWLPW